MIIADPVQRIKPSGQTRARGAFVSEFREPIPFPDQGKELARELVKDGKSISAVARTFNVHPATIDRVIEA